MRTWMLALAAGLVLPRFLPALPAAWGWLALAALGCALLVRRRWAALGLFLLGFSWACFQSQSAMDDRLPVSKDGRTFWIEGTVVGLPVSADNVVRFELEDIDSRHDGLPSKVRLSWYGGPTLQAGERWRLAARLKRPRGLVNPQSFDYEAWLLARRIGATGTVKAGERLLMPAATEGWRDRLRARLMAIPASGRQGAITALVVGDDSGLSRSDWQVLQNTGTVHLMVISGQHIGILAGMLYGLIALLARSGLWPRRVPWLPWACGLALTGALAYGWLAGFDVPVRRACLMVAVVLLWRLRFRHLGVWQPLLLALNGVLLIDPLVTLQPGFWLSFGAVAVLALVFSGRLGQWAWWKALVRAQWAAAIGLLPLLLALGLPVSASGPLANLIAVPWVSLTVPFALLGTVLLPLGGVGETLLLAVGWCLALLFELLTIISGWQPAWLAGGLSFWAWALIALGVLLLLMPSGLPLRALGLIMLLPLAFPPSASVSDGQAQVWMLDVGQGLSVLVRTRKHALLYDAGPSQGDFDMGERVVFPSLRALGVDGLNMLLLSHADNDHAGGAQAIQRLMPVHRVASGEPQRHPAGLNAEMCENGAEWQWDNVRFRLWHWQAAGDSNQRSCVLLVEANGEKVLLTGDIDQAAERALLLSGPAVQAQWLLLPHHGSRSSSSEPFLRAVGPTAALISRSLHNAFGHPHPNVIARLEALGVESYDTALHGAVRIDLGRFSPAQVQRAERRFWREK
ncbi:DNA internalization-related competence protein ComEC/Rec2 [Stutzerimonas stutzeri]|uniref:DNA internalization-related competence protein ComEC/Rec2 n=1 Tax=Stutzerimonas stutzeri TaxID=316 RepID=A0A2N8RJN6_STUST|nr:DNA internalization-related competence protein ComEC/Rec2 [Stutzerimonas stutzeri]MCQ4252475.1 DNA internalization-related competence protein ComEC/Rec2 [Stutzerimonas stutzeri]PNF61280.1 DNA internalization-related competence protein ComEC/Rec2 [Stutzerimonas stutzeri]